MMEDRQFYASLWQTFLNDRFVRESVVTSTGITFMELFEEIQRRAIECGACKQVPS